MPENFQVEAAEISLLLGAPYHVALRWVLDGKPIPPPVEVDKRMTVAYLKQLLEGEAIKDPSTLSAYIRSLQTRVFRSPEGVGFINAQGLRKLGKTTTDG